MNDYWKMRQLEAQNRITERGIKKTNKVLREQYRRAQKKLITDFENTYNKVQASIRGGSLPMNTDLYKLDRYWKMEAELRKVLNEMGEEQKEVLTAFLKENYNAVYENTVIPGLNSISQDAAAAIVNQAWCGDGKLFSQRIWDNMNLLNNTLNEEFVHCAVTGQKTSELKKLLQERFQVSYSSAERLVRTEMAHIQTEAALQRYKDYGIKEVEFYAAPDERTCDSCGELHGKRFPIDNGLIVPLHPNCRCTILPVVE